jgi:hypothetical protein
MSALKKAIDEIKFTIPKEILGLAFNDKIVSYRTAPITIDEQIMSRVIRPRVLVDANIVGGIQAVIDLSSISPLFLDEYTVVFQIPTERLNFKNIISVLNVSYLPYGPNYNSYGSGLGSVNANNITDIASVGQRIADSVSNIPLISNANAELVGPNTVMLRSQARITTSYQLRCMLGNDDNLNNISPRSWHAFSELCVLAVKSFIYKEMIIAIDQAYLTGGQELGSVKNYIEGLSDAEENYRTYLKEKWMATAFMNDTMAYDRFIAIQMSPGL